MLGPEAMVVLAALVVAAIYVVGGVLLVRWVVRMLQRKDHT